MIDLSQVRFILEEAQELVEELDGVDLDESTAVTSQSKGRDRRERAELSQSLNLLGDRLLLASSLVKVEYWHARGFEDPLRSHRSH
jgi:hypothetical protein